MHSAVPGLLALFLLFAPLAALAEDKTETQSVIFDRDNKELTSSALIKLLNDKLDGVYQDLELIITSCFGGEFASRAGGAKGLKGDWSVSTATDKDHGNKTLAGAVKGAGNFQIGGSTFNGWLPAWISKLTTDKNTIGNKALAEYATAEKLKAITGSTPQYNSSGKTADDMTVHGGKQSNHAILFQTVGFTKVIDGLKSALKGAGYADPEINQIPDKDLTWDKFSAALDDLRKKLDANPKEEKVLIDIDTHGGLEERTVAYAPGQFGQAGGGAIVNALNSTLRIHVDDPVVLASLGQDLLKPGGGVFSHDPDLARYGPATLRFSTSFEAFTNPGSVGIFVDNIGIGRLNLGVSTGGDYQITIPDSVLSQILDNIMTTGVLDVGFELLSTSDSFRFATSEDWSSDSYRNLDYGIGIAANCCNTVSEPPTLPTLALGLVLLLVLRIMNAIAEERYQVPQRRA